jgi:hypothetical protein
MDYCASCFCVDFGNIFIIFCYQISKINMPLITRKQFAELCGDRPDAIVVWIKRKKIWTVPDNKKLIDTDNPINAAFANERQVFNAAKEMGGAPVKQDKIVAEKPINATKEAKIKPEKPIKPAKIVTKIPKKVTEKVGRATKLTLIKPEKPVEKGPTPAEIQQKERVLAMQNEIAQRRLSQDEAKKAQDMELQALKIQSEKIRLDKTAGNLLPIDLAAGVIERHANTILKTFEKGFERIAELYSNMAGFDPVQRGEFMKECREELSLCVTTAGEQSQNEIDILVDNYSETLMTGQRKA